MTMSFADSMGLVVTSVFRSAPVTPSRWKSLLERLCRARCSRLVDGLEPGMDSTKLVEGVVVPEHAPRGVQAPPRLGLTAGWQVRLNVPAFGSPSRKIDVVVRPFRRSGDSPFPLHGSPTNEVTSSLTSCSAVTATAARTSLHQAFAGLLTQVHQSTGCSLPRLPQRTRTSRLTATCGLRTLLQAALLVVAEASTTPVRPTG